MTSNINFVAIDLGASSGRLVTGGWNGRRFSLEELHRFENQGIEEAGHLHWDVSRLWAEIKCGLTKYSARYGDSPAGISVDTWGVDYALLDASGTLLGNPYHYRDGRTDGIPDRLFAQVPQREIFCQTGIQTLQFNTLFQLYSMVLAGDRCLDAAGTLLMMPDLFHYWLSGEKSAEYTDATTTQMLRCRERDWARELLARLGIPDRILPAVIDAGTVLAPIRSQVLKEYGLTDSFPVIAGATHDTASAVAAVPNLDADSAYISSGTWALMGVEVDQPVTSERAFSLNFTNEGSAGGKLMLLRNITGLWLLQECVGQWRREGKNYSWDEVVQLASQARPFASLVDPDAGDFLRGGDMPTRIRAYCRRNGQPEPPDHGAVARCCLESLSLKCRWVLDALESLARRTYQTIRIVGGGSQNRLLCQFTADACARMVVAGPVEASALGNVMIQAVATGHLDSIAAGRTAIAAEADLAWYQPSHTEAWDCAYQKFTGLDTIRVL